MGGSRGDWIRTSDLLLPKQALYRAKLRPVYCEELTTGPGGPDPQRAREDSNL